MSVSVEPKCEKCRIHRCARVNMALQNSAHLHEVAGRHGLTDVGVVLARVEIRADELGPQPCGNSHLDTHPEALQLLQHAMSTEFCAMYIS